MSCDATSDMPLDLQVLQSEIDRNNAEKVRIEAETKELKTRLRWSRCGISLASFLKAILGGVAAGFLIWGFCLNHLLAIHQSNEIRLKDLVEKEEALSIRNSNLEKANEELRNSVLEFEKQVMAFKSQLGSAKGGNSDSVNIEVDRTLSWLESEAYRLNDPISIDMGCDAGRQSSSVETAGKWVYIGYYHSGAWRNTYFSTSPEVLPTALSGTSATSLVEVNVRRRPYDGAVAGVLRRGAKVRFDSIKVRGVGGEGYVWGRLSR